VKNRFAKVNDEYNAIMIKMFRKNDLASPLSEFLGIVLIASVLWFGGQLVFSGEITGSFFIVYIATLSQLISPFKSLTNAYSGAQRGLAALERIKEITEAPITIQDAKNAVVLSNFSQKVSYENVSFKYQNEYVLKNVSFDLEIGKTIALVGQSGSGKSTWPICCLDSTKWKKGRLRLMVIMLKT
jgi:ATP-binding cassette, subfamily B, bacterial MsbA